MQSHFSENYKIITKVIKVSFDNYPLFFNKEKIIELLNLTNKEYENLLINYNPSSFDKKRLDVIEKKIITYYKFYINLVQVYQNKYSINSFLENNKINDLEELIKYNNNFEVFLYYK